MSVKKSATLLVLAVSFSLALATVSSAKEPGCRLAVIASPEVDRLGITDPVIAELAEVPGVTLVDRTSIDRVRKELDLAALCELEGLKGRQALGKSVGADMLVVLREVKKKKGKNDGLPKESGPSGRRIQLFVVDCRYGVRLVDMQVLFDGEKTITAIRQQVAATCKKYAKGIQQVIGIMPLVSKTAYGRLEPLQSGLGRLLEKLLVQKANFAVLDTKECLLIERERKLGTIPNTSVPITILKGSYDIEKVDGAKPNLKLTFEAARDGKAVDQKTFTEPQDTLQNIRVSADSINRILAFLEKTLHTSGTIQFTPKGIDAAAEELFKQVQLQADLGEFALSCDLAEAILLMKPDHVNARLYAMGGYRFRCQDLKLIYLKRPVFSSDDTEALKKVRIDAALLRNRLIHRWLDHMEYLIRNKQISMARASLLYSTSNLVNSVFAELKHDLLPSRRPQPSPASLVLSTKKVLEHHARSVLTMMRDYVKDLPMTDNPSLTRAIGYCMASSYYRSDLAWKRRDDEVEAMKKKKYAHLLKYWSPDSRESQLTCWNYASFMLIPCLHNEVRKCYEDDRQKYLAFAKELVAFEEACVRGHRTKGMVFIYVGHYEYGPNDDRHFKDGETMICVPELNEHYRAMFDRFEQDKDPAIQFYGKLGKVTLRRLKDPKTERLQNGSVTSEEIEHFKKTVKLFEELDPFAKELIKDAPKKNMIFPWADIPELKSIKYCHDRDLRSRLKSSVKELKKLAGSATVLESGEEPIDPRCLEVAKRQLRRWSGQRLKGIYFVDEERDPLKVYGKPVRLKTYLARGRTCAWYSLVPDVDTSSWVSLQKLDEKTDLVVTRYTLLLMKKPGRLETIFDLVPPEERAAKYGYLRKNSSQRNDFIKNVVYDGKYLWVTSNHSGIYALTREGRLVGKIFDARGFPFSAVEKADNAWSRPLLYMIAESPGKTLVVLKTKTSVIIGRMKVDDSGKIVFEPLHLADKTPVEPSVEAFRATDVSFYPGPWMHLFKYSDKQQWLAIPRSMTNSRDETYSMLWINVKNPSEIRADKQVLTSFPKRRSRFFNYYWFDYPPLSVPGNRAVGFQYGDARCNTKYPVQLCEVTPPPLEELGTSPASFKRLADPQEKGYFNCRKPQFVTQDEKFIFVIRPGEKFVRVDKETMKVESWPMLGQTEKIDNSDAMCSAHHFVSAHYGIVALLSERLVCKEFGGCSFTRHRMYQVKLDDKGPKLSSYFDKVPPEHFKRHAKAMERLVKANAYVVPWQDSRRSCVLDYATIDNGHVAESGDGCSIRIDGKTKDLNGAFRALPDVYAIKNLVIDRAGVTEKHLETLARCSIKRLALNLPPNKKGETPLNDKTFRKLLENEKLNHLFIKGNGLTNEAFATVENAKGLKIVELLSDRFQGEVFSYLAKAPSLRLLVFQGPNYTDKHLLSLSESHRISLFFYKTQITAVGLARVYAKWQQREKEQREAENEKRRKEWKQKAEEMLRRRKSQPNPRGASGTLPGQPEVDQGEQPAEEGEEEAGGEDPSRDGTMQGLVGDLLRRGVLIGDADGEHPVEDADKSDHGPEGHDPERVKASFEFFHGELSYTMNLMLFLLSDAFAGEVAGAEGGLEVVAADGAVEVE